MYRRMPVYQGKVVKKKFGFYVNFCFSLVAETSEVPSCVVVDLFTSRCLSALSLSRNWLQNHHHPSGREESEAGALVSTHAASISCCCQNSSTVSQQQHSKPPPCSSSVSFYLFFMSQDSVRVVSRCRKRVLVYEWNCCWMSSSFCPQGHLGTGEVLHHLPLLFPRGSGESLTPPAAAAPP